MSVLRLESLHRFFYHNRKNWFTEPSFEFMESDGDNIIFELRDDMDWHPKKYQLVCQRLSDRWALWLDGKHVGDLT